MRRKVLWIPRRELYLNGKRCFAIADPETWQVEIDYDYHRSERQVLLTESHELGHILFPDLGERKVASKFEHLGAELYRLGYRKR
jgi:hypothetical protein